MATAVSEPPLFVRAYFADSVEDTLDRAREDLGPDALLLNEREAPAESRHLGAFEVVFGVRRSAPDRVRQNRGQAKEDFRQSVDDLPDEVKRNRGGAREGFAGHAGWRSPIAEHLV